MLGYTEMEVGDTTIWTKDIQVSTSSVEIPVNVTIVLTHEGPCKLTQSRASIIPGIIYQSRTSGLQKSMERTIQKCVRNFYMSSHVADRVNDEFFPYVKKVLRTISSLPPENISSLIVPVVTSTRILFTDKIGNQMTLENCLLVPMKGTSVVIVNPDKLEEWLKVLEEAVNLRCEF